jgi:hypothetical protein
MRRQTEINIFSPEMDQFAEGLKFKKVTFMSKFFTDGLQKKAQAKADGNPAMGGGAHGNAPPCVTFCEGALLNGSSKKRSWLAHGVEKG